MICPGCGSEISNLSGICPECGMILNLGEGSETKPDKVANYNPIEKKIDSKAVKIVIIFVLIVLVSAGFAALVSFLRTDKERKAKKAEIKAIEAVIQDSMKAYFEGDIPESLSRTDIASHADTLSRYLLEHYKNGYGGSDTKSMVITEILRSESSQEVILPCLDKAALSYITDFEIKDVTVDKDTAEAELELTVKNLNEVPYPDFEEVRGIVEKNAVESGLAVDLIKGAALGLLTGGGGVATMLPSIASSGGKTLVSSMAMLYVSMLKEAPDKTETVILTLDKTEDEWIINLQGKIDDFSNDICDSFYNWIVDNLKLAFN